MGWQAAIVTTVTGLGYDLVDTERLPRGLLRVTIDRLPGDPAGEFITVEDCERVTRQLQHVLEVEGGAYERLEVSSPGLDRLLRTPAHFARFVGEKIDLTLKMPFEGRKHYTGVLHSQSVAGADDGLPAAPSSSVDAAAMVPTTPWRLVLDDEKMPKAAGNAAGKAVAPAVARAVAGARALDFTLDEVREARLVPVVDFKGRRFAPPNIATADDANANEGLAMELRDK